MPETEAPYQWQQAAWQQLQRARREDRMPHALLLEGAEGTGKQALAQAMAHSLLCPRTGREGRPCGHCRACELTRAGTHPDLLRLAPDSDRSSQQISVDSVRELIETLGLKSQFEGYRIAIICPAEAMNIHAANAMLKTLEEPVADTVLILVSSRPARLPATVRSRCQRLVVPVPERDSARAWLAGVCGQAPPAQVELALDFSGNAPLRARQLLESDFNAVQERLFTQWETVCMRGADPLAVAAQWSQELDMHLALRWLLYITMGMICVRTGAGRQQLPGELRERLRGIAEAVDLNQLFRYLDVLYYYRGVSEAPVNQTLVLETLLIPWWYQLRWPLESLTRSDPSEKAAATWP